MLSNLLTPFEFGLGGPIGSGEQWMSWIERDDLVRLIAHIDRDAEAHRRGQCDRADAGDGMRTSRSELGRALASAGAVADAGSFAASARRRSC